MSHASSPRGFEAGRLYYGGDYNPEQWPREVWQEDVRLMKEAGVNLVTVGVFSWARLEPQEGVFDFSWMRELLDLLGNAGISVDLATPTASPPPWLAHRYPESLPVDQRGVRYSVGSRQHFCVLSPAYRRYARRITERLAEELAGHAAVLMWHIHNEYACHVPYCYCDHHLVGFQEWLRRRYQTLEQLNEAWGTSFWSQDYSTFEEIQLPRMTPTFANPAQVLDYKRFSSDAYLEEMLEEREILRRARPGIPVTTNFMGFFKPLDYFRWAEELDVVSTDNYQDPSDDEAAAWSAMHYDLVRSLNKSAPWMVMEQASFRVNWRSHNVPKAPGQMRALSHQALARGARGVLFFQWRASRFGAEKFHSAMVGHSGTASPVWEEIKRLGGEISRLSAFSGPRPKASVAVVFSWPNWWALEGDAVPSRELTMLGQLKWMCGPLYKRGAVLDFCRPDEDLDSYEAVIVPSLYLVSEAEAQNLVSYVERGGIAVVSFWSGIVDHNDRVYLGPYGGPLRPLIGCDVLDVAPIPPTQEVAVAWVGGGRSSAQLWVDLAAEREGKVLARVDSGPWAGYAAVVETKLGSGLAYYVASRLDEDGLGFLYGRIPALASMLSAQVGLERVVRADGARTWEHLINQTPLPVEVEEAPSEAEELLGGERIDGKLNLDPFGVAILQH